MADFSTLIASIEATIKQNGVQAITGQVLQDELLAMVAAINQLKQDTLEGYSFYGEALPNGATRVVTQNTFFLAGAGSYTINGNAITISDGGISVIVYDCVNDEITTYLLFAYDANPTSGSANAVTSGGVKSALDTKADKNGASPDLFAGFAGNLVDTRSAGTRQGPFAFRQSGGDGVNYMRKILGRTEVFNQLINPYIRTDTQQGITFSVSANCMITVSDTFTGSYYGLTVNSPGFSLIQGHKYIFKETLIGDRSRVAGYYIIGSDGTYIPSLRTNDVITYTGTTRTDAVLQLIFNQTSTGVTFNFSSQIIGVDLTLLYGSAIAGMTDAEILAKYMADHSLGYYSPASKLINNAATGLETTGKNIFDEQWDLGYWDASGWHANSNFLGCKNRIPVLPNTAYYWKCPTNVREIEYWDAANNYLGRTSYGEGVANTTFTTPADCTSITFYFGGSYGSVYKFDVCINISSADFNGQYEPYWERTVALPLNSIPCHDENNNAVVVNGLDGVGTSQDELVVENGWGVKIIKRRGRRAYQAGDESDATLMTDGTNTDYPLPTPKVLTLDNPIPALIEVDNLGTEKRLPEDTADNPQAPFECDSNYSISTANLVRKLSE